MSKKKEVKNQKEDSKNRIIIEPERVRKQQQRVEVGISRTMTDSPILKSFRIVCEGPTEAAYFEGLCAEFDIKACFKIEVLPEKGKEDGYKGSSVKNLLYMAMKLQKLDKIPFDEVWIVCDNDEENAFKLDAISLERIQKIVPQPIFETIKTLQTQEMNVRKQDEAKKDRIRYFLSQSDYQAFLAKYVPKPDISTIIGNTLKKSDFTDLYGTNPKSFFYDSTGKFIRLNDEGIVVYEEKFFDKNWQSHFKIAYSCISFEYWLLLHFEYSIKAFYNSREIIKYFDDNHYFDHSFEKGWYLYINRNRLSIKTFFNNSYQAILNNIALIGSTHTQSCLLAGKKHYEINPYSDVYQLVASLLWKSKVTIGSSTNPINEYRKLQYIHAVRSSDNIVITFIYQRKQSVLKKQLENGFSIINLEKVEILFKTTTTNSEIIRDKDNVVIQLTLASVPSEPLFLFFKETDKGLEHSLVWNI